MDEIIRMIIKNRKLNATGYILIGVLLGLGYTDFRGKLNSIESRLANVETRIGAVESNKKIAKYE